MNTKQHKRPPWGVDPGPRVVHRWNCTRRGPYTQTLVQRPTGQGVVVVRCEECNGDDATDPRDARGGHLHGFFKNAVDRSRPSRTEGAPKIKKTEGVSRDHG